MGLWSRRSSSAAGSQRLGKLAFLFSTLPGSALIVAGGPDEEQISSDIEALKDRHDGFQYAANVVKIGQGSGVYLGSDGGVGYLLTAGHVGDDISSVTVTGITYAVRDSEPIGSADLQLITIGGEVGDPSLPDLPQVQISKDGVDVGKRLLLMGRSTKVTFSPVSDASTSTNGIEAYNWGAAGEINWAENEVEKAPDWLGGDKVANWSAEENYEQTVFFTRFDDEEEKELLEGSAGGGDSGGPAFVQDEKTGDYRLAGITHGVQTRYGQKKRTTEKGNLTAFIDLSAVSDQLPDLTVESQTGTEDVAMREGLGSRISLIKR